MKTADSENSAATGIVWPLSFRQRVHLVRRARAYIRTEGLPCVGWVVFGGRPVSGWMRCDLDDDLAANGRLTHRPGCLAVNPLTGQVAIAVGGDDQAGANRWEVIQ